MTIDRGDGSPSQRLRSPRASAMLRPRLIAVRSMAAILSDNEQKRIATSWSGSKWQCAFLDSGMPCKGHYNRLPGRVILRESLR